MKRSRRRRIGIALLALGAASTIPIGMRVMRASDAARPSPAAAPPSW
jgi:hypothetical protein